MTDTKVCTQCSIEKPLEAFHRTQGGKFGRKFECKSCSSARSKQYQARTNYAAIRRSKKNAEDPLWRIKQAQYYRERDPKRIWAWYAAGRANYRAKKRGVPSTMTGPYLYSIASDMCPILGIPLAYGARSIVSTGSPRPDSPSVDCIKPELGYVPGNVAVISQKANIIKSNATPEEILRVAKWFSDQLNISA